jgi:hypothetical protein
MNEIHINRGVTIWLTFPAAGTLSGVLSYSSETEGVRFHSYRELMTVLQRLATAAAGGGHTGSATTLKLAS